MRSSSIKTETLLQRREDRPSKNTRDRIITSAARLFAQKGYEASSVGDLAADIGISKAAIYHYFATKREIYDAIIFNVLSGLVKFVSKEVMSQDSPTEKLRSFMTSHACYFEAYHNEFVSMLIGFSGMHEAAKLKQEVVRLRDDYENMLRNIIDEGIRDKSFDQLDSVTATRSILSMLNWMARWFKPEKEVKAEEVALDYYHLLMRGLARRCCESATYSTQDT